MNKYHLGPVEYTMEEKEKIPGEWNRQMEINNTQYDDGCVERMRRRR